MIIRPLFTLLRIATLYLILLAILSCEKEDPERELRYYGASDSWLIDSTKIIGRLNNSFPVLTNANYTPIKDLTDLSADSKVLIVRSADQTFVYPTERLWVEVVNEKHNKDYFAITWCPITESGVAWNRVYGSDTLAFAASGMLYKENLVPYDTSYLSFWSQMLNQGIKGKFSVNKTRNYQVIETTLQTTKEIASDALVFNVHTAEDCNYPEEFIAASTSLPRTYKNSEDNESRLYGIIESTAALEFEKGGRILLVDTSRFKQSGSLIETGRYIIIYDKQRQYITSFIKGTSSEFLFTPDTFPIILTDEFQNKYNIYGQIVEGPDKGNRLNAPASYSAKKWAFDSFFNQIDYLEEN